MPSVEGLGTPHIVVQCLYTCHPSHWPSMRQSNTPNGIIPCQHVADPGIGLPLGPDLPSASLLPSSLGPSGRRGPWQSPNPSPPVREGRTATPPSRASISLIHWAGAPWEWSAHMDSPRFCLLVPSESTHPQEPQRRGAHYEAPVPILHCPLSPEEALPLVVVQCVCLEDLWCGNVIPGANTGLLKGVAWCGCLHQGEKQALMRTVHACELTAKGA